MKRMFVVATVAGPWASLGLHVHVWPLRSSHIDLHLLWWILTIGPYAYEIRAMGEALEASEAESEGAPVPPP